MKSSKTRYKLGGTKKKPVKPRENSQKWGNNPVKLGKNLKQRKKNMKTT